MEYNLVRYFKYKNCTRWIFEITVFAILVKLFNAHLMNREKF